MKKITLLAFAISTLSGCVNVSESGYYWGDYSHSYYSYLQEPSKETISEHYEVLLNIIETSDIKKLKVPAGIYAELGYMHSKKGEHDAANTFYNKEIELYPESAVLIGTLIKQLKAQTPTNKVTETTEQQ